MKSSSFERVITYSVLIAFTVMVIYPILSIVFLALHQKSDLVTGFAFPTHPNLSSFKAAWTEDDGAGAIREFFVVTLPGLRNELVVAFVLTTINALRSFDLIYNATSGGPGNETYVPSLLVFQNAFQYNKVGYSCAIAVMLAVVIFVVAVVINLLAERGQEA